MVSAQRPRGERDDEQPELVLRERAPEPGGRPGRGLAARRHKTWESRFKAGQGEREHPLAGRGAGWEVLSYLLAGMVTYGGLGWVIGHFTRIQVLFPIGMLAGIAISLCWIVYKYGRQK